MRSLAWLVLLALAGPARADTRLSIDPGLALGAGWDSNLYLDAHLTGTIQPVADGIVEIAPKLFALADLPRAALSLAYDLDARVTFAHGAITDQAARLGLTVPLAPVKLGLAALGEAYQLACLDGDAACHPEDSFLLGGGEGFAQVKAGRFAQIGLSYRGDARSYPDRSQLDAEQRALVWLELAEPAPSRRWRIEVRALYLHVGSNAAAADLDRVRGELYAALQPFRIARVQIGYDFAWQQLPSPADGLGARTDLIHHGFAQVEVWLLPWLAAFARADLVLSTSDRSSGQYDRVLALTGLSARATFAHTVTRRPPLAPDVTARAVRFRARFPGAAQVAVVGDWSGWQRQALAPLGDGRFEGALAVPPGRHRYALSVDGRVERPPDAPAYAPDGFGGIDGVIEVPGP